MTYIATEPVKDLLIQESREKLEKKLEWYSDKYGPYIGGRGMHNWKNLFRKPNIYEWVILLMVILSLFMYWAYSIDVNSSFQNGYNSCLNNLTLGGINYGG